MAGGKNSSLHIDEIIDSQSEHSDSIRTDDSMDKTEKTPGGSKKEVQVVKLSTFKR